MVRRKKRSSGLAWKIALIVSLVPLLIFVAFIFYLLFSTVISTTAETPKIIDDACNFHCNYYTEDSKSYATFQEWDPKEFSCECYDESEDLIDTLSYTLKDNKVFCDNCEEGIAKVFPLNHSRFDSYPYEKELRNKDFRLVCVENCAASDKRFNEAYDDLVKYTNLLKDITKTNVDENLSPFEAHATKDYLCDLDSETVLAYASKMIDGDGIHRGLMCLKANEIASDQLVLHELTHLFQYNRFPQDDAAADMLLEGHAEVMSSLVFPSNANKSFCWYGNSPEAHINEAEYRLYRNGRTLFYDLCNEYGFDSDDMPELFKELEEHPINNSYDFVNVVNGIVGRNTQPVFERAGFYEVQYTETGINWGGN